MAAPTTVDDALREQLHGLRHLRQLLDLIDPRTPEGATRKHLAPEVVVTVLIGLDRQISEAEAWRREVKAATHHQGE